MFKTLLPLKKDLESDILFELKELKRGRLIEKKFKQGKIHLVNNKPAKIVKIDYLKRELHFKPANKRVRTAPIKTVQIVLKK